MASFAIWLTTLAVCLAAVVLAVSARQPPLHASTAAVVIFIMAITAAAENWRQRRAGASENVVAGTSARQMGLVWIWGALALLLTYFLFLKWREWLVFSGGFALIGILCLLFAAMLDRDERAGRRDPTMLNLAKNLSIGQLVGCLIAMIGLVIDGKFPVTVSQNPVNQDWAANNIFFFGALGVAIITANALYTKYRRKQLVQGNSA
jgi:hypothetical protein